jgi:DNA-binding HxlR family transcriptional regulator
MGQDGSAGFEQQLSFWPILCFYRSRTETEAARMAGDTLTSNLDSFREAALSCPIPAAVELIGEKWAFLILRGAFNGLRHFEEFQAGLGIARNILSDRLGRLVAGGILERSNDASDRRRVIYALTPKGEGLLPVVVALRQWGAKWGNGEGEVALCDRQDRMPIRRICVQAQDGRPLELDDLIWIKSNEPASAEAAELV